MLKIKYNEKLKLDVKDRKYLTPVIEYCKLSPLTFMIIGLKACKIDYQERNNLMIFDIIDEKDIVYKEMNYLEKKELRRYKKWNKELKKKQ